MDELIALVQWPLRPMLVFAKCAAADRSRYALLGYQLRGP